MNLREMLDAMLGKKTKQQKPTHVIIGTMTQPHFFGGRVRKVRKIVKRYGGNVTRMMAEHPELRGTKVIERPVRVVREIDHQGEYRRKKWKKG